MIQSLCRLNIHRIVIKIDPDLMYPDYRPDDNHPETLPLLFNSYKSQVYQELRQIEKADGDKRTHKRIEAEGKYQALQTLETILSSADLL